MQPGAPFALDRRARLSPDGARAWRARTRASPGDAPAPDALFGPFDHLPADTQHAVRTLVARESAAVLRWTSLGRWHIALTRVLWRVYGPSDLLHVERSRARLIAGALAYRVWYGPLRIATTVRTAVARLRFRLSRRPSLACAFAAAGRPVQQLADAWATGLPVDRRVRGYASDAATGNVHGFLLGIDLVPTARGCVCLEANLNPAMREERIALYGTDPIASGIIAFAAARGLRRVVLVGFDFMVINPALRAQLEQCGATAGIAVTVLDDPRAAAPHDRASRRSGYWLPEVATTHTLVIQVRHFGVGPARLVHHKLLLQHALDAYQRATGESSYRVEPLRAEPDLSGDPGDPRLPNLVYKYVGMDRGDGVHFFKAETADHARALARALDRKARRTDGMFQPFLHPPLLDGDRTYDLRTFALLTAAGAAYLGSLRKESAHPVPHRLEPGVVADLSPFLMNPYFGNPYTRASDTDESSAEAAIHGIARAVDHSIRSTYVTD